LFSLVEKYGVKVWSNVAVEMAENGHVRNGKQCRERWCNHLNPEVRKEEWTGEEDAIILEAHEKMGNKWTEISKLLSGRPANAVKNHWNSSLRRKISQDKKRKREKGHNEPRAKYLKREHSQTEDDNDSRKQADKKSKPDDRIESWGITMNNDQKPIPKSLPKLDSNAKMDRSEVRSHKNETSSDNEVGSSEESDSPRSTECLTFDPAAKVDNNNNNNQSVLVQSARPSDEDLDVWYEVCAYSSCTVSEQPWTGGYLEEYFSSSL